MESKWMGKSFYTIANPVMNKKKIKPGFKSLNASPWKVELIARDSQ